MDSIQIKVRKCLPEDAPIVADFNARMALETENKKLAVDLVTRGAKNFINRPNLGTYYMAEVHQADGSVINAGCTMITYEMNPRYGGIVYMIQSVFVIPEFRGKKVFRTIYTTVVDQAKADPKVKGVRLYVEKENTTAMAVYEKLGMSKFDHCDFDEKDFIL